MCGDIHIYILADIPIDIREGRRVGLRGDIRGDTRGDRHITYLETYI